MIKFVQDVFQLFNARINLYRAMSGPTVRRFAALPTFRHQRPDICMLTGIVHVTEIHICYSIHPSTLPGQFKDVHSPGKLSDHDIVPGTLKNSIPPIKKPRRKVYLYQKGDYESMRKDTLEFAKEKYFNGHSDTRSVQENFDLLTYFIQDSADKHIPSKTSRSVSSIPWITPVIRRKIRRKNKTHAKAKKTGSSKLRSKFETLRRAG